VIIRHICVIRVPSNLKMKTINFNNNKFTYLSEEVRQAMEDANLLMQTYKPISFGRDYKIMAETENARNYIADKLKLSAHEIFFSHGNQNSDIEIINQAVLFLKIEHIFTSIFENKQKLEYLKNLQSAGKISLSYIETSEFGEIKLKDLNDKLSQIGSKSILSLSHANLYTGILLPVKDVLTICRTNHVYFHLDISLTIGRYQIDFEKFKPDFVNFDSSLLQGPVGVGIQIINNKIDMELNGYQCITNSFGILENKNLAQILGLYKAFSISLIHIETNRLGIIKLREYFLKKANSLLKIKVLIEANKKPGLYNLIPLYIDKNIGGDYFIEKLDLNGIFVQNLKFPIEINSDRQFINIALNEGITEEDIDYFFEKFNE